MNTHIRPSSLQSFKPLTKSWPFNLTPNNRPSSAFLNSIITVIDYSSKRAGSNLRYWLDGLRMKALVKSREAPACGSKMLPSPSPASMTSKFAYSPQAFAGPMCIFTTGTTGQSPRFAFRWSSATNLPARLSPWDRTSQTCIPETWSAAKAMSSVDAAAIASRDGDIYARTRRVSE